MKIVTSREMSAIEAQAYRDGASEEDFMEEAGTGVALVVHDYAETYDLPRIVILLCGKGNNGGDAYVAGCHLMTLDYEVFALQVTPIEECSRLCKSNYERFIYEGGNLIDIHATFPPQGIIVDGLFGTGFHGNLPKEYAAVVAKANKSRLPIIAIDIPSGLNGETGEVGITGAIIARETAFLELPKLGFFLKEGWNHVGNLRHVHFGLAQQYIDAHTSSLEMLTSEILAPIMPIIKRNRHKYQAGAVVGLAGSPGMPGAALLSSSAALRSGAGLVRLLHPDGMQAELASSPYELIRVPYDRDHPQEIIDNLNRASAVFVGPGIGRTPEIHQLLRNVLPHIQKPCVIDADALTILSQEDITLPHQTVLTPHLGELMRLLGITTTPLLTLDFLNTCRTFAMKKHVTLVLKGAPTFIMAAEGPIYVNPTGDPGMATAGSGDVLTGIIAGLLAQGMPPKEAAALGVFIHGLAGEYAAEEYTSYGVIASDIIYYLSDAIKDIKI